ncbi:MAG: fibronectin type III domain-containing protein [Kiritimatiellae bacterium]|nr:fibronectin type III domain-containing protein [Kiritimatiellia bacterium]
MCVALAFLAGAAHLPLKAVTTNAVDIAALIAAVDAGHSETNGWALSGLSKYAKGADYASNPACVKFDTKGDWLESNDFGARIVGIGFALRCSATDTASRFLYVRDLAGAEIGVVTNCSRANRCESQFLSFGQDADFSQFRIVLDGSGNTGVWGIGEMFVVTADPVFAPTGIAVVRTNANYCVLAWENGANTVSNRVDTLLVERGAGETPLIETGFDTFSAIDKKNPVDSADKVPQIDSALSGVNIYAPTNTSGICQIGKGDELGFIRYDGISDYSNVVLRLRAKRYLGDNAETTIVSVDPAGMTNEVETIVLVADYADYEINLSSITNEGSALLLGYYKTKSHRRVLLDSMSIVRLSADRETQIDSRFISAAPGQTRFRLPFDLAPKAEYRFSVRAVNGDGIMSDEATIGARALRNSGSVYYIL